MPGSFLSRLRLLPLGLWDRLLEVWYCGDRTKLLLAAVPLALLCVLASLTRFAYLEHVETRQRAHRQAELRCLAENVYYEGRGEPLEGQYAVAEVTMNRVASPRFPDTVCGVVHERRLDPLRGRYVGAFSWTELDLRPPAGQAWLRAWEVAETVHDGRHPPALPAALHYHATTIVPRWAHGQTPLARIGNHIFYH